MGKMVVRLGKESVGGGDGDGGGGDLGGVHLRKLRGDGGVLLGEAGVGLAGVLRLLRKRLRGGLGV